MDDRVIALWDRLIGADEIDPQKAITQWRDLHRALTEEADRVSCIKGYLATMEIARRHGADLEETAQLQEAEMRLFCIVEARDRHGCTDPAALVRVIEREIAAGRMHEGNFAELARTNAAGLASGKSRPTLGLFDRSRG